MTTRYDAMCDARRAFARAWSAWVRETPSRADVVAERDGTLRQIQQLTATEWPDLRTGSMPPLGPQR